MEDEASQYTNKSDQGGDSYKHEGKFLVSQFNTAFSEKAATKNERCALLHSVDVALVNT